MPPGEQGWDDSSVNVMPDLAMAMKRNPKLKVLLMGGYYDLGCTFFGAIYEDKHLQIPQSLQSNINYKFFQTGPHGLHHHARSKRTPRRHRRLHPQHRRRHQINPNATGPPFGGSRSHLHKPCHSERRLHARVILNVAFWGPMDRDVHGVGEVKDLLLSKPPPQHIHIALPKLP